MTETPQDRSPDAPDAAAPPDPGIGAEAGSQGAAPPTDPDPFAPVAGRVRTRWIHPRRRWATGLIAVGAAIVVFAGGVGAGLGVARHNDGPAGRFHVWTDRGDVSGPDRMPWPGTGRSRGPGMQQFPGYRQHRGPDGMPGPGSGRNPGSSPSPSSSSSSSPSPSPSSSSSSG